MPKFTGPLVTDIPLLKDHEIPEFVHEVLEEIPGALEVRGGKVATYDKEQFLLYDRARQLHCMFDRELLTPEGFECALYNLGWGKEHRKHRLTVH